MGTGLLLRSDTGRGFCYQKRLSALILSALRFIHLRKCFPKPPAKVNLQHSRGSLSIVWFLGIWLRNTGTPPLEGENSHNKTFFAHAFSAPCQQCVSDLSTRKHGENSSWRGSTWHTWNFQSSTVKVCSLRNHLFCRHVILISRCGRL